MTTHPFLRLAALVTLLAAPCIAFAQYNPEPENCKCITIEITPAKNIDQSTVSQENGNYDFDFTVTVGTSSSGSIPGCDQITVPTSTVTVVSKTDPSVSGTVASTGSGSYSATIDGSKLTTGGTSWKIVVTPSGTPTQPVTASGSTGCEKPFTLGDELLRA